MSFTKYMCTFLKERCSIKIETELKREKSLTRTTLIGQQLIKYQISIFKLLILASQRTWIIVRNRWNINRNNLKHFWLHFSQNRHQKSPAVDLVTRLALKVLEKSEDWTEIFEGRQGYNKLYCPETSSNTEEILLKRNF